jgi:RNA polymerase sigma-70 factor (ECF subfamily)
MSYDLAGEQWYTAYKPLLFSHAYRMLGSVMDAEDVVHDAFITLNSADLSAIRNPKSYLCKIVTNRCIDRLRSARKQREVYVGPWLPEPLLTESADSSFSDPAARYLLQESMSTAYVLLLQQLSAVERAVFLLREALQYEYDEIADMVGKSSTNCRQIYHRAKRSMSAQEGTTAEQTELAAAARAESDKIGRIVEQFLQALTVGDIPKVLSLLAEDAILYSDGGGKVKAAVRPIEGADRISRFFAGLLTKIPEGFSVQLTGVNGQPGIVTFEHGRPLTVLSFRIEAGLIASVYTVVNPDKLRHLQPKQPTND